MKIVVTEYDLYTQKDGRKYICIRNYKALKKAMYRAYGREWKEVVLDTYGPEQFGLLD